MKWIVLAFALYACHGPYVDIPAPECGVPIQASTRVDVAVTLFAGDRPTVIIINTEAFRQLPNQAVSYGILAHECGHVYYGSDEYTADVFAVCWLERRGLSREPFNHWLYQHTSDRQRKERIEGVICDDL